MNDHINFQGYKKNIHDKLFLKTHKANVNKENLGFNTLLETIHYNNNDFVSYSSFEFKNNTNPYYNFISKDYEELHFYNNLTNTNVVIPSNHAQDNLNYLISYQHQFNQNNKFNIGYLNEQRKFLGSYSSGIFENKPNTKTYFIDYQGKLTLAGTNFLSDFTIGNTEVEFLKPNFIKDTRFISSAYSLGINKNFENIKLKSIIGFAQPLSIVDGNLVIHTVSGYNSTGDYVNKSQEINLTNQNNYIYFNNYKFFNNNSFVGLDLKVNENTYNIFAFYTLKF